MCVIIPNKNIRKSSGYVFFFLISAMLLERMTSYLAPMFGNETVWNVTSSSSHVIMGWNLKQDWQNKVRGNWLFFKLYIYHDSSGVNLGNQHKDEWGNSCTCCG